MSDFIPLKRFELSGLKEGTNLKLRDGKIVYFEDFDESDTPVGVRDEEDSFEWYELKEVSLYKPKGENFNMEAIKSYLEKHRDLFLTLGIVLILDHFVFEGAFREKTKSIINAMLDKRTKEITHGKQS